MFFLCLIKREQVFIVLNFNNINILKMSYPLTKNALKYFMCSLYYT